MGKGTMAGHLKLFDPPRDGGGSLGPWWTNKPLHLQRLQITQSWGSNPASGSVTYVTAGNAEPPAPITAGSLVICTSEYGHYFCGLAKSDNPVQSAQGHNRTIEFVDLREFLEWDDIYCVFNKPEKRLVNGRLVKRYWHRLPKDYDAGINYFTDTPFTAYGILRIILNRNSNPTIESPWINGVYEPVFHDFQRAFTLVTLPDGRSAEYPTYPVLDLDFSGVKLSAALVQIANAQGLTFTLSSTPNHPYRLWFTRKGEGALPEYDNSDNAQRNRIFPKNSDQRRNGVSLSGNPTRVRILGDRNLYQVLNVPMAPDWNINLHQFYDVQYLVDYLFNNLTLPVAVGTVPAGTRYNAVDPPENISGYQLAAARASTMTLRELCNVMGNQYADHRLYAGRCRMEMPVALYVETLLFRAFRPPNIIEIDGIHRPLTSLQMMGENLVQLTHNQATGIISPALVADATQRVDGNGYAIVQGYSVGQDSFRTLRPENFRVQDWADSQRLWQFVPFQIDDSGEDGGFVIFDDPVINSGVTSQCLLTTVTGSNNETITVMRADPFGMPSIVAPYVRAALTFAAERFTRWMRSQNGGQLRDATESVPSLRRESIVINGRSQELTYEDGYTATDKADWIAAALLQRQYSFNQGGFTRYLMPGDAPIGLYATYDRVTVDLSSDGDRETVDFTTERGPNAFQPERDFDRRQTQDRLFPGQKRLQEKANQLELQAVALRQSPTMRRTLSLAFRGLVDPEELTRPTRILNHALPLPFGLAFGTPIWKHPTEGDGTKNTHTLAMLATNPLSSTATEFVGVVARDGEDITGSLRLQNKGVVYAMVKGPVLKGDPLGKSSQTNMLDDYLEKNTTNPVGVLFDPSVPAGKTCIARVQLGMGSGGGAGSNLSWKMEWNPYGSYKVGDIVICGSNNLSNESNLNITAEGASMLSKGILRAAASTVNRKPMPERAGTYICIKDITQAQKGVAPYEPDSTGFWETFARFSAQTWSIVKDNNAILFNESDAAIPAGAKVGIDLSHCKIASDPTGRDIRLREYEYCKDGVTYRVILLGSLLIDPVSGNEVEPI